MAEEEDGGAQSTFVLATPGVVRHETALRGPGVFIEGGETYRSNVQHGRCSAREPDSGVGAAVPADGGGVMVERAGVVLLALLLVQSKRTLAGSRRQDPGQGRSSESRSRRC